jgi:hypothetical protein
MALDLLPYLLRSGRPIHPGSIFSALRWLGRLSRSARERLLGVKLGDVRAMTKKIKTDHELALNLWNTGNVDPSPSSTSQPSSTSHAATAESDLGLMMSVARSCASTSISLRRISR